MLKTNGFGGLLSARAERLRAISARSARAAALSVLLAVPGCQPPVRPSVDQPNLLFISIDTLRADALGVYGQRLAPSPNIDRLAAEGVRFEHCSTAAPSTLPSHATMFTGKYPYAHGVRANAGYLLHDSEVTLAEVLREAGYATGAEVAAPVISRRTQLNQGFDQYRDTSDFDIELTSREVNGETETYPERDASDITRHALRFIETHADEPFFLWLHYFDVHSYYLPPNPFATRFAKSGYHGEVAYVDDQLARVWSALEQHGIDDRTLVVLTSDHGEGLGEHAETTHTFFVYDTTIRVPLIVRGPSVAEGVVSDEFVATVDLMPTLLDLLGLAPPSGMQGRSFASSLRGRGGAMDDETLAYGESLEPLNVFGASVLRFVRRGSWKYIHKVEPELYDTSTDPLELENRADRNPGVVRELRSALGALVEATPLPTGRARTAVDPSTIEQLLLLGYVPTSPPPRTLELEVDSLEAHPPDPSTLARDFSLFSQAWGGVQSDQLEASRSIFEGLADRHPDSASILQGLILVYEQLGLADETPALLRRALELNPGDPIFATKLGRLRGEAGDLDEAERVLTDALNIEPCASQPRIVLSNLLHDAGRYEAQLAVLHEGNERCPASTDLANDYAYALATLANPELRDGDKALAIARRVVATTDGASPALIDTLACALAETGDFEQAVIESERALSVLGLRKSDSASSDVFRAHLDTLRSGRAVRD
ncbi:MAG: sulfatase-like hydrolase/transferase [Myxococcales bacterium]|nr:sulfatase-like hydrolase/transferase [Myxococcales bacterium]